MSLFTYMQRTQLLLMDQEFAKFNDADIINYINMGRGQIAGETECIRLFATLAVDNTSQVYPFSGISIGTPATTGIQGVINVSQINFAVASGQKPVYSRPWPWFQMYVLGNPVPDGGPPRTWSQYGQGATGSLYVNLLDGAYTLSLDTACYPIQLTDDLSVEAIPYQWTDAIPFYSAYLALLTAQDYERAEKMWAEYQKFIHRAGGAATPAVLPGNFARAPDPMMPNRLGLQQKGG